MVSEQVTLQLGILMDVSFTTEIGCGGGGVKDPAVDLNAMPTNVPPVPLVTTVGADETPLGAFRYTPSPSGRVVYGELQPFQGPGLFPCMICRTASVALRVSPTP